MRFLGNWLLLSHRHSTGQIVISRVCAFYFCTDLICFHNNFVSLLSVNNAVKWLLFAFLIRDFVLFLYFLYSAKFRRFLFISLYLRACAISGLYHGGIRLILTLFVLIGACWLRPLSNISYHAVGSVSISDSLTEYRLKSSNRSTKNVCSFGDLKHR